MDGVGRGVVHAREEGGLGQVHLVHRHVKLVRYGLLDLTLHFSEMDSAWSSRIKSIVAEPAKNVVSLTV